MRRLELEYLSSESGLTLLEVTVVLSVFALVAIALATTVSHGLQIELLSRQQLFVRQAVLARFQEIRTLSTNQVRLLDGSTFTVWEAPTGARLGSPELPLASLPIMQTTTGPLEVSFDATVTGTLAVQEVALLDGETAAENTGFFRVTASVIWLGALNENEGYQHTTWVVSHDR